MTTEYTPIDCDQHSVLEVLAMRRQLVQVEHVAADGRIQTEVGRIIDVAARGGEEFIVVEVGTQRRSLRLDRLRTIDVDSRCVFRRQ